MSAGTGIRIGLVLVCWDARMLTAVRCWLDAGMTVLLLLQILWCRQILSLVWVWFWALILDFLGRRWGRVRQSINQALSVRPAICISVFGIWICISVSVSVSVSAAVVCRRSARMMSDHTVPVSFIEFFHAKKIYARVVVFNFLFVSPHISPVVDFWFQIVLLCFFLWYWVLVIGYFVFCIWYWDGWMRLLLVGPEYTRWSGAGLRNRMGRSVDRWIDGSVGPVVWSITLQAGHVVVDQLVVAAGFFEFELFMYLCSH